MNLKLTATVITGAVVLAGFAMISPLFLKADGTENEKQKVMLSFNITQDTKDDKWCKNLSDLLNDSRTGAAVFFTGKVAEQYPECVSCFSDKVDIGSQTYSYCDLATIADYSMKLKEVEDGKIAVDRAGNLDSSMFRAPFYSTDQDIYSLLSRCGILADFSYKSQYNLYLDGQFLRFDTATFNGRDLATDLPLRLPQTTLPLIINFDDKDSIDSIKSFISSLDKENYEIVNASQIAGFALTQTRRR